MNWESAGSKTGAMDLTKLLANLKSIKCPSLIKFKRTKELDNIVVTLNASVTSKILIIYSLLLTGKDLFGEEINCVINSIPGLTKNQIIDYCWVDGIFSVIDSPGHQSPYTGVSSLQVNDGQKFYHKYYQWVYVSLLVQGAMFYTPRWIWLYGQDSRVNKILEAFVHKNKHINEFNQEEAANIVQRVADLLFSDCTIYYWVVLTDIYSWTHIVFQIWATDMFLDRNFRLLGVKWFEFAQGIVTHEEGDPLRRIFPRVVKCSINMFGMSGGFNTYDGLCFLHANSVNEKIYLTLWFWLHFLLLIVSLVLLWRAFTLACPWIRIMSLTWTGSKYSGEKYRKLCRQSPGNWYLLHILSTQLSTSYFIDFMDLVLEKHFDKRCKPRYNSCYGEVVKLRTIKAEPSSGGEDKGKSNGDDWGVVRNDEKKGEFVIHWPEEGETPQW